jgi:predicted DNA-binding transcriptional regulator AlpA
MDNNKPSAVPQLLTQDQLSEMFQISVRTLEDWRLIGSGPPYIKLGRLVRYSADAVSLWLSDHRVDGKNS